MEMSLSDFKEGVSSTFLISVIFVNCLSFPFAIYVILLLLFNGTAKGADQVAGIRQAI
jgi:hypothetical protein